MWNKYRATDHKQIQHYGKQGSVRRSKQPVFVYDKQHACDRDHVIHIDSIGNFSQVVEYPGFDYEAGIIAQQCNRKAAHQHIENMVNERVAEIKQVCKKRENA